MSTITVDLKHNAITETWFEDMGHGEYETGVTHFIPKDASRLRFMSHIIDCVKNFKKEFQRTSKHDQVWRLVK